MIPIATSRIYELGGYTIRAQPLQTNPHWTTHLIFKGEKLIGRQLSTPTLADCEWLDKHGGVYAEESESAPQRGYTMQSIFRRTGGPGRRRKKPKSRPRSLAELLDIAGQI